MVPCGIHNFWENVSEEKRGWWWGMMGGFGYMCCSCSGGDYDDESVVGELIVSRAILGWAFG